MLMRGRSVIREKFKNVYHYLLILKSGLFDSAYYLNTYLDIQKANVNPLWHFVRFGWREGRNPSENFNVSYYLKKYSDVRKLELNPLVHFIKYGYKENRSVLSMSDTFSPIGVSVFYPLVSIIIPVFNSQKYLISCVEAVFNNKINCSFEVIVVGNISDEKIKSRLSEIEQNYSELTCIYLGENTGLGEIINLGINQSKGEFVVILSNDTIPTSGWLDQLIKAFKCDEFLGIASPLTNWANDSAQTDLDSQQIKPKEINHYAAKIASRDIIDYESNRLDFFCVMIRRVVIDLIGLLDENFIDSSFVVDDYCLRTARAGFRLGVVQSAFVYRYNSPKVLKDNQFNCLDNFDENRERFYQKAGRIASLVRVTNWHPFTQEKPMVSVIVRTLNRPKLLRFALNSLANQSYNSFELVLVNDGGDDLSDVIKQFEFFFPIQYIRRKKTFGRTAALNVGLSLCKGKWISILDDDDIYYPWHLETMIKATTIHTSFKFFFGQYNRVLMDRELELVPLSIKEGEHFDYSRQSLLVSNRIPINTWLFSKEIVKSQGEFDEGLEVLEDYEFLLRVGETYSIKGVNKVICEYRYYLSQINSITKNRDRFLDALVRIYDRYPSENTKMDDQRNNVLSLYKEQYKRLSLIQQELEQATEEEKRMLYFKILSIVGAL